LNNSTGNYSWLTAEIDVGVYSWYFNASDGYGGIDTETITVTINSGVSGNFTPALSSVTNSTCFAHSCNVTFTVNQSNALTYVRYGLNSSLLDNTTNQTTGTNRTDNITGLVNNTLYYYSVWAWNSSNTSLVTNSSIGNFTTAEDFVPPSPGSPAITYYDPASLTPTVDVNNLYTFNSGANQSVNWTWTNVTEGLVTVLQIVQLHKHGLLQELKL